MLLNVKEKFKNKKVRKKQKVQIVCYIHFLIKYEIVKAIRTDMPGDYLIQNIKYEVRLGKWYNKHIYKIIVSRNMSELK